MSNGFSSSAGGGGIAIAAPSSTSSMNGDEAAQGLSSSSSSSIYRHPFQSFNFGSSPSDTSSSKEAAFGGESGSLSSRMDRMSLSGQPRDYDGAGSAAESAGDLTIPPSPATSYAESQLSHDEYEMGSPSSLSSWNSWMSGHRGDIADVEDLELGEPEPELETVSEVDEDLASSTITLQGQSSQSSQTPLQQASPRRHHTQYSHHHLYHQHVPTSSHGHHPVHVSAGGYHGLSHFSPRTGGHGLSHHSRWTSRTPASLAARRRKGRIAELAEEGAGEIKTTQMPSPDATPEQSSSSGNSSPTAHTFGGGAMDTSHYNGHHHAQHHYAGTPHSTQWSDFSGPPALPIRPVSPSETIPAVPSPLCECIASDGGETVAGEAPNTAPHLSSGLPSLTLPDRSIVFDGDNTDLQTPTLHRVETETEDNRFISSSPTPIRATLPGRADAVLVVSQQEDSSPPSPSSTVSRAGTSSSADYVPAPSSPDTTPPSSPVQPLVRKGSARARRSSSPTRSSKAKIPLRPCFSRRNSGQMRRSGRDSSSERESIRQCHVRFSPAPPQTIRAHSPIDYDRSSCPISNRLSVEDVEEMQNMEMDMGLLSAKCSAIAALSSCKLPKKAASTSDIPKVSKSMGSPSKEDVVANSLLSPSDAAGSTATNGRGASYADKRRDSTGGLLQSGAYFVSSAASSPAEHLRMQREKERERACRMAGIGTGLGGRNLGKGVKGQATNPLIARFGLNSTPPPLPSSRDSYRGQTPSTPPPTPVSMDAPIYSPDRTPSASPPRAASAKPLANRPTRASSLQRTDSEERARWRSTTVQNDDDLTDRENDDRCATPLPEPKGLEPEERGRSTLRRDGAMAQAGNSSSSSGSSAKKLPSLTRTSPSPSPPPPPPASPLSRRADGDQTTYAWSPERSVGHSSHSPVRQGSSSRNSRSGSPLGKPTSSSPHSPTKIIPSPTRSERPAMRATWSNASTASSTASASPMRGLSCGYDSPGSAYESGSEYDLLR